MKICVIGCGAVGSLFAAHLAKAAEVEVWAYDVWADHVAAIQKNGLRISGAADLTASLNATSDPKQFTQRWRSPKWRMSSMKEAQCARYKMASAMKKLSPSM